MWRAIEKSADVDNKNNGGHSTRYANLRFQKKFVLFQAEHEIWLNKEKEGSVRSMVKSLPSPYRPVMIGSQSKHNQIDNFGESDDGEEESVSPTDSEKLSFLIT